MSKEKKLIPELRFPGFVNDGEWKKKQLSEILDYERPDNYIVSETNYKTEGTPVLTANKSFVLGYTDEDYGIYKELPAIIFDDFTVDSKFVDFPFKVKSSAIKILKPKGTDDLKFAFELISQIKFEAKEHKRYYISEFQNLYVPIPEPQEQQKIASCLFSLDKVIAAHSQKLDALKDHKKGLMQNLFPQEGETVPKYRFPEFENEGEWVEKKLGKISKRVLSKNKDGRITSVFTNSAIDGIVDQRDYFDKDIANKKSLDNYYLVENGDYVYNPRISVYAPVGPISKNRMGKTGAMSPLYTVFRFNEMDNDFYEYYFQTSHWHSSIRSASNTGARFDRMSITALAFMEIPVLHTSSKEQQKIASCLSALDELITAQVEKIAQLQLHKKGLMQGLFPKVND